MSGSVPLFNQIEAEYQRFSIDSNGTMQLSCDTITERSFLPLRGVVNVCVQILIWILFFF